MWKRHEGYVCDLVCLLICLSTYLKKFRTSFRRQNFHEIEMAQASSKEATNSIPGLT